MAQLIDGKMVSKTIQEGLVKEIEDFVFKTGVTPTLAAVLIGDDPASETYVRMKHNTCHKLGMKSETIRLPSTTSTQEAILCIKELNIRKEIHGILLQHPVPKQIDERLVFDTIDIAKDVDGVTTLGFGRLSFGIPTFGCCTPAGIMTLLDYYKIPIEGKEAVIIGRSPILGRPMAMMLMHRNATITVCHSRTNNLKEVCQRGDILVAAVGKPEFVKGDWIKKGAVVIDAGYNPGNVGDVDFKAAEAVSSMITPVPGGVGPMTITTLMQNTLLAAQKQILGDV